MLPTFWRKYFETNRPTLSSLVLAVLLLPEVETGRKTEKFLAKS
jgi:hypothetical protein